MRQKVPVRGRGGSGQATSSTSISKTSQHGKVRSTAFERKPETTVTSTDDADDENSGFGGWLKSDDGVGYMKMFVITNSVIMLTTVGWPHITKTFQILKDLIYGDEEA